MEEQQMNVRFHKNGTTEPIKYVHLKVVDNEAERYNQINVQFHNEQQNQLKAMSIPNQSTNGEEWGSPK